MSSSQLETKGIIASLFDLDFKNFITLRFLKIIYTIVIVVIGLGALIVFIAFASRGFGAAVFALILVPIVSLLYLIFARVYLELIALLFRIAENTTLIAQALAPGRPGPAAPQPGYPPAPPTFGQPGYGEPGQAPPGGY